MKIFMTEYKKKIVINNMKERQKTRFNRNRCKGMSEYTNWHPEDFINIQPCKNLDEYVQQTIKDEYIKRDMRLKIKSLETEIKALKAHIDLMNKFPNNSPHHHHYECQVSEDMMKDLDKLAQTKWWMYYPYGPYINEEIAMKDQDPGKRHEALTKLQQTFLETPKNINIVGENKPKIEPTETSFRTVPTISPIPTSEEESIKTDLGLALDKYNDDILKGKTETRNDNDCNSFDDMISEVERPNYKRRYRKRKYYY